MNSLSYSLNHYKNTNSPRIHYFFVTWIWMHYLLRDFTGNSSFFTWIHYLFPKFPMDSLSPSWFLFEFIFFFSNLLQPDQNMMIPELRQLFSKEDFESSKFLSLSGEETNWFFPIGYSKSSTSMWHSSFEVSSYFGQSVVVYYAEMLQSNLCVAIECMEIKIQMLHSDL